MKTSFVSNLGVQTSMRQTVAQAQAQMIKAQKEVTTGTFADRGVSLGWQTGRSLNLTSQVNRIHTLLDSNSIVDQRLTSSQAALGNISENAGSLRDALLALSGSSDSTLTRTAVETASQAIDAFVAAANTSANGEYVFAGINTDVKPITEYSDTSAAKVTFDTEFASYFGFAPTSGSASTITKTQMDDFLTNYLEPLYTGTQWEADWSAASDTNMSSRISTSETISSSTNANEDGFRYFALGAVIANELLNTSINSGVRQLVSEKAVSYINAGITGTDAQRTSLGLSQERLKSADKTLETQLDIMQTNLNGLIEVDVYEASTLVTALQTQVETAYTLTAKLQQLSLANYL